ncbi:MAG: GDP-mannose 4,6-dehydratase, partial [Pseudomonadota bacterium]
ETYAVGGRAECTNIDLVRTLCAIMDERAPDAAWGRHESLITFVKDRPGHDQRYSVNSAKIERALGWTAKTPLRDGLAQTVDWYLANPGWIDRVRAQGFTGERLGHVDPVAVV